MRKRNKLGLLLMAVASAGVIAPGAQAAVIDNFNTPGNNVQTVLDFDNALGSFTGTLNTNAYTGLPADILGTSRKLFVDLGPGAQAVSLTVTGYGLGFALDEASPDAPGSPIAPSIAHMTWDGTANTAALSTLSAWDFLSAGDGYFAIQTNSDNYVDTKIRIEVWNTGAAANNSVANTYELNDYSSPQGNAYAFDFNDFAGINFASVGAIRLHFLTDNISINSFETVGGNPPIVTAPVPVPAAAGLGLLGMGIVSFMRRRKNAQA